MGNKGSQTELSPELEKLACEVFNLFDVDGSKTIELSETVAFWSKNFAKINAQQMFSAVDSNNDGVIQEEEWLCFWKKVKSCGYSEDDISEELNALKRGESWVQFKGVR